LLGLVIGLHGALMSTLGEFQISTLLFTEAYRLCREVGDVSLTASRANNLGWNALCTGDTVEARAKLDEALELDRLINNTGAIGADTVNLGWVDLLEGDRDGARSCFEAAAGLGRRIGTRAHVAEALWGFAQVAAARDDPDRAARLAGAAAALGAPAGYDPAASVTFARHLEDSRTTLGDQAWQKAWADGAELDLDAALTLALEQ
jgi:hypothetical protein